VVSPQHESWPDLKTVFELAKRLGLSDQFWSGDIEAGFNYHLAPLGITVEELRNNPGPLKIDLKMEYQKYRKKDTAGHFVGFSTPSKRVEIYSQLFKDHGYDPLPTWKAHTAVCSAQEDPAKTYPLILTGGKVVEYSLSQNRALPSLRKRVPNPFLEINPQKAKELGINNGDWVILETPYGGNTLQAVFTEGIDPDVVCAQNGWWQACPELNLPSYDPYSPEGANNNLLYAVREIDPISGSIPHRGFPCNVRKKMM
jgi:anaerobic selenocysteine-containing dehydrogenase